MVKQTINYDQKGPGGIISSYTLQGSMQNWVLRSHNTATLISDFKRDIGLDSPKGSKELSPKGIIDGEDAVIKCYDRFNNWKNSFGNTLFIFWACCLS